MCIDNKEISSDNGVLGRLVDETGELKDPSNCIIQYGGRVRLPDKLMEILNKEFAPDVMWWQPDGECFAFDSETVQKKILDVWFRGTKLSSFIRSLNRWGFRRVFYHALPEAALAFHHSAFRKTSTPEMLKTMKMSKSGKALAAKAEEPTPVPSAPKPLLQTSLQSPLMTANRLTTLANMSAASSSPRSLSVLPQLPLSNSASAARVNQQEALLKLFGEQRNRNLLSLASTGNTSLAYPASAGSSSSGTVQSALERLLMQQRVRLQEEQQQNLVMLARQELAQQQQRKDSALQLALLSLQRQNGQSLL